MKRKHWIIAIPVIVLLSVAVLFTSCAASANQLQLRGLSNTFDMPESYAEEDAVAYTMAQAVSDEMNGEAWSAKAAAQVDANDVDYEANEVAVRAAGEDAGAAEPASVTGRKLIKDISAYVETKEYEKYVEAVEAKAFALGGHISVKDTSDGGYYADQAARSATIVMRVPAEKLEEFKKALGENGKVTNINESVRDVTMEYTDVDAHIKVLRTERDALMKLLEQSNNTEELLLVREQLTRVRYELDALEGKMRVMEDQITLSAVTLHVQEVERITQERAKGFWAGAWDMFKNNMSNIGQGLRDFSQGFLGAIPYLVLLLIPVIIVVIVIRRSTKKRRASKAAQQP